MLVPFGPAEPFFMSKIHSYFVRLPPFCNNFLSCCFLGAGYYGCLPVTSEVAPALTPAALIQSDSDRRIKMQILACVLLAILSLSFFLCGMWRRMELERCPPRLNIQITA